MPRPAPVTATALPSSMPIGSSPQFDSGSLRGDHRLLGDGARPLIVGLAAGMAANVLAVGDRTWRLEAGDRFRDELAQLVGVECRTRTLLNDAHDLLAEPLARSPDDERIDDVGVPAH